jgi:hypothetical protein
MDLGSLSTMAWPTAAGWVVLVIWIICRVLPDSLDTRVPQDVDLHPEGESL